MGKQASVFISELAKDAGVNRETVRYYERRGLLHPASRTASGYRVYDQESAARLRFIKRAQAFGFSLEEIRALVGMKPENPRSCNRVMKMLDTKLEELAKRIQEMKQFHQQLAGYRKQCDEALAEGESCPVIVTVGRSKELELEKT